MIRQLTSLLGTLLLAIATLGVTDTTQAQTIKEIKAAGGSRSASPRPGR